MKKEEIYVPIANKKEAKRAKSVLKALGEDVSKYDFYKGQEDALWFYDNNYWTTCLNKVTDSCRGRKEITLKQLIEMLVNHDGMGAPKKIAVKVENEKEFKVGDYVYIKDATLCCFGARNKRGVIVDTSSKFSRGLDENDEFDYKIKIEGEIWAVKGVFEKINPPLLTSEDGVDLYEGDEFYIVEDFKLSEWDVTKHKNHFDRRIFIADILSFPLPKGKPFSTKEAALDWIEAKKPKQKVLEYGAYKFTIKKDSVNVSHGDSDTDIDIKAIYKTMQELS